MRLLRFYNVVSYIFLGVLLLLAYWYVYPYKLIEFKNSPFPVINENAIVQNGDRLRYKIDYCKYTDESPTVVKYFIDGVIYEVNTVDGILEKGCHQSVMDVYVPKAIPGGSYSVKVVATFKPNPIRKIKYTSQTQNFIVVK